MYQNLSGLKSIGRTIIRAADAVSQGAQRVSGAVKGAGVGAQTAPVHPYIGPALVGALGLLLVLAATRRRK